MAGVSSLATTSCWLLGSSTGCICCLAERLSEWTPGWHASLAGRHDGQHESVYPRYRALSAALEVNTTAYRELWLQCSLSHAMGLHAILLTSCSDAVYVLFLAVFPTCKNSMCPTVTVRVCAALHACRVHKQALLVSGLC